MMYKNIQNKFLKEYNIKKKINNKKLFYEQKKDIEEKIKLKLIYDFLKYGIIDDFMNRDLKINILNYELFEDAYYDIILVFSIYPDVFLNNIMLCNDFKIISNIFDDEQKICYVKKIKNHECKNLILFKNITLNK